jgi:hypothetical protein
MFHTLYVSKSVSSTHEIQQVLTLPLSILMTQLHERLFDNVEFHVEFRVKFRATREEEEIRSNNQKQEDIDGTGEVKH